ncbi:hypothetical protein CLV63_11255 [Murinocardiopsis flavida]|uniref:Uncharacterized protein n=1 Tax=Murinocardiopsis flavida TaxID=645275 RepID=A0A2P8DG35_9ACTN|nr:hypothetical protein [Murinocardiopsis flavida]PSK96173.1 hypothetical protein CLV63_11255 [Murinocardiopsis flavida]
MVAEARRRDLLLRSTADETGLGLTPVLTCEHADLDAIADRVCAAVEACIEAPPPRVRLGPGRR